MSPPCGRSGRGNQINVVTLGKCFDILNMPEMDKEWESLLPTQGPFGIQCPLKRWNALNRKTFFVMFKVNRLKKLLVSCSILHPGLQLWQLDNFLFSMWEAGVDCGSGRWGLCPIYNSMFTNGFKSTLWCQVTNMYHCLVHVFLTSTSLIWIYV